ncbi:MAG: hypothetical protein FWF54_08435 [Candidatus Azobacteroides sp.]|nr:hypothetical protein [Candidatus Azobacteroides sp.]
MKKIYYYLKLLSAVVFPIFILYYVVFYAIFFYMIIGNTKIATIKRNAIYTDNIEFKDDIIQIMDTCMKKLENNNISIHQKYTILFSTTIDKYNRNTFYLAKGSLGNNYSMMNVLVLAPADYKRNLQHKYDEKLFNRRLSDVIAHELTHSYLKEKMGFFKYIKMNFFGKWKNEGFCEFIANSSSFNIEDGKRIFVENGEEQEKLKSNKDILAYSYFYFTSRLKTDYLLSYKKISLNEFLNTDFNETDLENEIRRSLLSKKYVFDKQ